VILRATGHCITYIEHGYLMNIRNVSRCCVAASWGYVSWRLKTPLPLNFVDFYENIVDTCTPDSTTTLFSVHAFEKRH